MHRRWEGRVEGSGRKAAGAGDELHNTRQTENLAHRERVAMLGELSGAIAHELNQPLTAILGNAQALEVILAQPEPNLYEAREITRDIIEDDRRASNLIQRLRALLRKSGGYAQPVDANECIMEVLELERGYLVARNVNVTLDLGSDLPRALADRVQLQQVLLNLIMNAADAMAELPPQERITTIHTRSTTEPADAILIDVADRGTGVPADQLQRIFEPFVTTKHQGLGLGLSISRLIVSEHGGSMWASNNPDRGLTVHVSLRAAAEAARD